MSRRDFSFVHRLAQSKADRERNIARFMSRYWKPQPIPQLTMWQALKALLALIWNRLKGAFRRGH